MWPNLPNCILHYPLSLWDFYAIVFHKYYLINIRTRPLENYKHEKKISIDPNTGTVFLLFIFRQGDIYKQARKTKLTGIEFGHET